MTKKNWKAEWPRPKTLFANRLHDILPNKGMSKIGQEYFLGASKNTILRYLSGDSEPSVSEVLRVSEVAGRDVSWLMTGKSASEHTSKQVAKQKEDGTAQLRLPPVIEIPAPKGKRFTFSGEEIPTRGLAAADDSGGSRVPDTDDFGEPIRFPSGLMGVPVVGDSMSPVILPGQYVEIDIEREGFERDKGIYVVSVREPEPDDDYPEPIIGTLVKRCERHENLYYLESINGSYSPFSVHVGHCRIWPVLGVWFGGKGSPPEGF